MILLSCLNCCHNPLQYGPVGAAVGYCTRHRVALLAPGETTCGQLWRKDLPREDANAEQAIHAKHFAQDHVRALHASQSLLVDPDVGAASADAVVDEVRDYGRVASKFSGLKALRRIKGPRAELGWLSLGRAYFSNCYRLDSRWEAGIHLLWWALQTVDHPPEVEFSDLRAPVTIPIVEFFDLARWHVLAARLMVIADVAQTATASANGVRSLPDTVATVLAKSEAGSGRSLLSQIGQRAGVFRKALEEDHYRAIAEKLHKKATPEA